MPPLATSDEQPDQISQNLEIRRNDYGNLDQGSAAFTTEEPQVKESTGCYGSTVSPRSPPCGQGVERIPAYPALFVKATDR
jgi:hypothetical protein